MKLPVVIIADWMTMLFGIFLVLLAVWFWYDAATTLNKAILVLEMAQGACVAYWAP